MKDQIIEDTEISTETTVMQAARNFAAALAETSEYIAFEKAA